MVILYCCCRKFGVLCLSLLNGKFLTMVDYLMTQEYTDVGSSNIMVNTRMERMMEFLEEKSALRLRLRIGADLLSFWDPFVGK